MKLFEIMLDKLNETALFEMAFERKKAKAKVVGLSPQIFRHLAKMLILNSPDDFKHWAGEVNGWMRDIQETTLKGNNKRIDKDTLYQWLVFESAPTYDETYIQTLKMYWEDDYPDALVLPHDESAVIVRMLTIIKNACADSEQGKFSKIEKYL